MLSTVLLIRKARKEMGGHDILLIPLSLILLGCMVVQGQPTEGFISIYAGVEAYNDSRTGISYMSDSEFVETGLIMQHREIFTNAPLNSVRSFPNGARNCYKIKPVIQGTKYLVRTRFLHGNYDGTEPTVSDALLFDIYLGVNFWQTMDIKNSSQELIAEVMVISTSTSLSICLVNTGQGTPFISAIELRPLPETLYLEANTSQSLLLINRWDSGGFNLPSIRYPVDIYDREWLPDSAEPNNSVWKIQNTTSSVHTSIFNEPSLVMKSMNSPKTGTSLDFSYPWRTKGKCPPSHAYMIMYFAELEKPLANSSRIFQVLSNDIVISDAIEPKYLQTTVEIFDFKLDIQERPQTSFYITLTFSISQLTTSKRPPIINALEAYSIVNMTCEYETRSLDVDAMMDIKAFYKVNKTWNGDPCAPIDFMWEGLKCSYNEFTNPFITSLDLSSSGLSGGITTTLGNLSELQYLDLSNNALTGEVPESLASLSQLTFLSLANNNLSGSIPTALLERSRNGNLNLSMEGNPFLCSNPDSCLKDRGKNSNKVLIIVLVCIGTVGAMGLLVLIYVCRLRKQRRQKDSFSVTSSEPVSKHGLPSTLHLEESTNFSFSDILEITSNFSRQIGRGGFGPVFYGSLVSNRQVAVKILSNSSSQGAREFQTEAKLLTRIHHRNLVPLIGYCDDTEHLALVYEYMEGGNLWDKLSDNTRGNSLSWSERLVIATGAAQGLEYLHKGCKPSIVHRDVKSSNILLTQNKEARISDFGLSKIFEEDGDTHMSTRVVGTPGYLDPEYNNTNKLNERSDVYSFGIVLMELITGLSAIIKGKENAHVIDWIQQRLGRGEIKEIVDSRIDSNYDVNSAWKMVEIAMACTAREPLQRPNISEVVSLLKECTETNMIREKNNNVFSGGTQDSGSSLAMDVVAPNDPSMVTPEAR